VKRRHGGEEERRAKTGGPAGERALKFTSSHTGRAGSEVTVHLDHRADANIAKISFSLSSLCHLSCGESWIRHTSR
jgi:hypothetical protein